MRKRMLVPALGVAVLVMWACVDQEPTSVPIELEPVTHTAPVDFSAVVTLTSAVALNDPCLTITPGEVIFEECQVSFTIAGDLVGENGIITIDATLEGLALPQQNGPTEGDLSVTACVTGGPFAGECGDFEGPFEGEFVAGQASDDFRLRGRTGGVKGIHIRGTFMETTPTSSVFDLTGTIRFPTR